MQKILVISLSRLMHDARVRRQVNFLKSTYHVTVACYDSLDDSSLEFIQLVPRKAGIFAKLWIAGLIILRQYRLAHKQLHHYPELDGIATAFDLIIVNDIECLPIALAMKNKAKVLFDAHEYFPRQFEDKFVWRILFQPMNFYLCRQYLHLADAMTTIGEGIADEYERVFGVKPVVVNNAAAFKDIEPSTVGEKSIKLIHHGIAIPSRRLELMIDMMSFLDDRFKLYLMLMTPQTANKKTRAYLNMLKKMAAPNPKITFIEPVNSEEIIATINQFDIGVILVPPINFNYKNGLGNKFFDFIQARLGMAIGPIPEMAKVVNQYKLGVVSEDFLAESLARKIISLSAGNVSNFKMNAERAAREINADKNNSIVNQIVSNLLASKKWFKTHISNGNNERQKTSFSPGSAYR